MLESSRSVVNSKMSEEEYVQEVVKLASHYGLDIERSNSIIIQKNKLDKDMYKQLETYKLSNKMKQLKSQLELAQRAGSMDLVRETDINMQQYCR